MSEDGILSDPVNFGDQSGISFPPPETAFTRELWDLIERHFGQPAPNSSVPQTDSALELSVHDEPTLYENHYWGA